MLDNFIGNSEIKNTIKSAVSCGRFPHAFIIEGEEGSGRKTLAKLIAAAAVCSDTNAPCGNCRECELVLNDGHCDVLTYAPDGATFKVDAVRDIRNDAYIMPIEAKRKVNILLDCDKMNDSAQNAFLKVLEEPPSFMVFILICHSASFLLPTVRSRCVTLSVTNPDTQEAAAFIKQKTNADEEAIISALESSNGNIGQALLYLKGNQNKAKADALAFWEFLVKKDRLGASVLMFSYEKDRAGFNAFLKEFRIVLSEKMRQTAFKNPVGVRSSSLAAIYAFCDKLGLAIKDHLGQPLSLPLYITYFVAEIFALL